MLKNAYSLTLKFENAEAASLHYAELESRELINDIDIDSELDNRIIRVIQDNELLNNIIYYMRNTENFTEELQILNCEVYFDVPTKFNDEYLNNLPRKQLVIELHANEIVQMHVVLYELQNVCNYIDFTPIEDEIL